MEPIFWISLALLAATYLGYPLALIAWDAGRQALEGWRFLGGGGDRRRLAGTASLPRLTVVVSAFDEAGCIRQKVENSLALDYPADRLEILIGCDGCTDTTAARARSVGDPRVKVVELSGRAGKAAVLNRLIPEASGDLILLTDANAMLEPGAARALARHFEDPAVGAAVGRLRLYDRERRAFAEGVYWKYETFLKHYEGKHGCVVGANGAIYALRRHLFAPLPAGTITDDFVIPMRLAMKGWRIPFEPAAVAVEEIAGDAPRELGRRTRIGAGNWQALRQLPGLLNPARGFLFAAFVTHKLLRWTAPLFLALAFVSHWVLAIRPEAYGYQLLLAPHLAFYGAALLGDEAPGQLGRISLAIRHFLQMNFALAAGFWRWARGTQAAAWERTPRGPAGAGGAAA
jgi:cellulose synthase/poly-beta-1,6-N-acetylglucosamine synthase-like glycosyltransferase